MGLYSGGLIIGWTFASEIWGRLIFGRAYLFIYLFILFYFFFLGGGGGGEGYYRNFTVV